MSKKLRVMKGVGTLTHSMDYIQRSICFLCNEQQVVPRARLYGLGNLSGSRLSRYISWSGGRHYRDDTYNLRCGLHDRCANQCSDLQVRYANPI